jgi:hypothetical protein
MEDVDKEVWRILTDFPKAHMVVNIIVAVLNLLLPGNSLSKSIGIGTILLGVIGRPFSKAQVAIGILQFFIWPWFLRYIWTIGWTVLIFVRHFRATKPAPADSVPKGGYDINPIGNSQNFFS